MPSAFESYRSSSLSYGPSGLGNRLIPVDRQPGRQKSQLCKVVLQGPYVLEAIHFHV